MIKKVLMGDDDEGIAYLLVMVLEQAGFNALTKINSLNVYRVIEKEQPDLLLLD
jgi:DNA-binding response OmpR family regulator